MKKKQAMIAAIATIAGLSLPEIQMVSRRKDEEERELTEDDKERMAKAELKRQRKAEKKKQLAGGEE